jgi:hypothetical protein
MCTVRCHKSLNVPSDDVLPLRDRVWEFSHSLVWYDTDHTSTVIAPAESRIVAGPPLGVVLCRGTFRADGYSTFGDVHRSTGGEPRVCLGLISLLWAHSFSKRREGRFSNWSRPPRLPRSLTFSTQTLCSLVPYLLFSYRYVIRGVPIQRLTVLPFLREECSVHTSNAFLVDSIRNRDESVSFPNFGSSGETKLRQSQFEPRA